MFADYSGFIFKTICEKFKNISENNCTMNPGLFEEHATKSKQIYTLQDYFYTRILSIISKILIRSMEKSKYLSRVLNFVSVSSLEFNL